MIRACSSFDLSAMAGGQSGELPGRPGLNPLRFATRYHVDENHYEMVKELAKITKINAARENSIQNGYSSPFEPRIIPLGKSVFVLDDHNWTDSIPDEIDTKRITDEIKEAGKQADIILVSLHAHETDASDTRIPARFIETFSRSCKCPLIPEWAAIWRPEAGTIPQATG